MAPLSLIVTILNLLVVYLILYSAIRKRMTSWWAIFLAYLSILFSIVDAIVRQSFWPIGTIVIMIFVLFILYSERKFQEIREMKERDQKVRAFLHEEMLRQKNQE